MEQPTIIVKWKSLLGFTQEVQVPESVELDMDNQRMIHSDCDRTRSTTITGEERKVMECLLTFYCKTEEINYKQGMNEILYPFLLLMREGLSLNEAYTLFSLFIKKLLPTMFKDEVSFIKTFRPLQGLFLIFKLLLKYHCPLISAKFKSNKIIPNLYLTSWLLTVFASKTTTLEAILSIWESVITENDKLFPCYISIVILENLRDVLLNEDPSAIPQLILSIRLSSPEEVEAIMNRARELKKNMPYSLHEKLMRYDVFKLETIDQIIFTLSKEICLSVHPRDVLQRTYPESQLCQTCVPAMCSCFPMFNTLPFIVIDCRTREEQEAGVLSNSEMLNEKAYGNDEYLLNITNEYLLLRGTYHICLMGRGAFRPKDEPSEDLDEMNSQNMLINMLQVFLMNDFPYISVVEGGFQKAHEFAMHYGLNIERHNKSCCLVCNPNGVKSNIIKDSLVKIGNKLVGRVRAFSAAVKNIVRSESTQIPHEEEEEIKDDKRKAISRRPSGDQINLNDNYSN